MSPKSLSSAAPSHPQAATGNSTTEDTLRSSSESSPAFTVNFSRKYAHTLERNSFKEMWSKIHPTTATHQLRWEQVLYPDRECVEDALLHAKSNTLTGLAKAYFDRTENAAHLCQLLLDSVCSARALYAGLHAFLRDSDSPSRSSFTQPQCNRVFDLFREFDRPGNPFAGHQSHGLNMFSQLKQDLCSCRKSRSRIGLLRSWGCCCRCSHFDSKEAARMAPLHDVLSSTIVLNEELNTVDCFVRHLCGAVDRDKSLVRMALERDSEKHFIINTLLTDHVVKEIRENHQSFEELEERICICFKSINKARALLLQEIHLHHTLSTDYRHRQGAQ
ncbi:UPF0496 protein At3g19330-like isoform X3 [Alnus glutinosa]|uniref:UPF0496 protein At3g19330-like isoform X3 n=1 Tax=Alnus glutinosa TaxID=3517 RepID=UPI002D76FB68|nr:UPF0496 protein At3g19330-like isoform X3 [Alnus glutinosa]